MKSKSKLKHIKEYNSFFNTNDQLINAVKSNDLQGVIDAIEKGADANYQDKNGDTALHIASSKGHTGIVKYLLDNGSDVNMKNN